MEQPKLSKKRLAEELETLRKRLMDVESQVEETLGEAADAAKSRVRELVGYEPLTDERREQLIRLLAALKSRRRGDNQAISHWLEAEEEVDMLLTELGLR